MTPNSAVFSRSTSTWRAEIGSAIGWSMFSVGTLWSSVATVRSGRRTVRPVRRSPSNACGLVTSWTRWRSMYSRSGSPRRRSARGGAPRSCAASVVRPSSSASDPARPGHPTVDSRCPRFGIAFLRMDSVSGVGVLDKAVLILPRAAAAARSTSPSSSRRAGCRGRRRTAWWSRSRQHHLVRRDGDGRFCLGLELVALGRLAGRAASALGELAAPTRCEQLRDDSGESVQLFVREGDARRCVRVAAVAARAALDRARGQPAAARASARPARVLSGERSRRAVDRERRGARGGRRVGQRAGARRDAASRRRGEHQRSGRAADALARVTRFGAAAWPSPQAAAAASRCADRHARPPSVDPRAAVTACDADRAYR